MGIMMLERMEEEEENWEDHLSTADQRQRNTLPTSFVSFLNFCCSSGLDFVDKTGLMAELPQRFRCLLLCPPKYGKSILIDMLHAYHDLHFSSEFLRRFNGLDISTKHPDMSHSQHLCLAIDFGLFYVHDDPVDIVSQFLDDFLHDGCLCFLERYSDKFGLEDLEQWRNQPKSNAFPGLLGLVERRGCPMLLTVDNFDAPFQTEALGGFGQLSPEVVALFESRFWTPLHHAPNAIQKLLVTGLFRPPLHNLPLPAPPEFDHLCGFTREEALGFATRVLGEPPDEDLLISCGEFGTSSTTQHHKSMLHPQLVLDWIGARIPISRWSEQPFHILKKILEHLPQSSPSTNIASIEGLITLVVAGRVQITRTQMDALVDGKATWAAILQAGGLAVSSEADHYRILNEEVLRLIHARIFDITEKRYMLGFDFSLVWADYCLWNSSLGLRTILCKIMRDAMHSTCFGAQPEPTLLGAFEVVFRHDEALEWRYLPPFVLGPQPQEAEPSRVVIGGHTEEDMSFDLITLSLEGMWYGLNVNEQRRPTPEELKTLFDRLCHVSFEELNQHPYRTSVNDMNVVRVETFTMCNLEVPRIVAVGGARIVHCHWKAEGEQGSTLDWDSWS
ncbi:AAA-ATPase-like domain-containing protein [Mycena indigotica]|uniref:AAA-ATPase-like domain-containing protein n=1 Tax=Mycena indigotica TaxID=2126181 RepID=A0A8H6S9T4_9AGAR|nr:AAA-ATPase-like domain-containing protein [Mycena indigotica]KAF7294761.1 AAA-ATPase-like domain-containing protein [Mycena indigotica]